MLADYDAVTAAAVALSGTDSDLTDDNDEEHRAEIVHAGDDNDNSEDDDDDGGAPAENGVDNDEN